MLTSLTWILWTQFSTSRAAQSERESKEITYAYAINGGFIIMALIGLYLDSFGQCRTYYGRWSSMNQELIILPYDMKKDTDYCTKTASLILSSHDNTFNTSSTFSVNITPAASTPNTSANECTSAESRDGTSSPFRKNSGFALDVEIFENPMAMDPELYAEAATSYVVNTPSNIQPTLHHDQPACEVALPNLQDILALRETYV